MSRMSIPLSVSRRLQRCLVMLAVVALTAVPLGGAQSQTQNQTPGESAGQQPAQTAPEAGGPSGDNGVIALPKKPEQPAPPPAPVAPTVTNPPGLGNITLQLNVPEVTVDVGVLLEKTHQFVPSLKPSNFRVYEDGVEQKVIGFKRIEAPITALLLCEFAANSYAFIYDMRNAAWDFTEQLRPQDYVALMTFDLRTQILLDFTQDKSQHPEGHQLRCRSPASARPNVFDALYEAIDRLSRIEGRKYIILIASGRDYLSPS